MALVVTVPVPLLHELGVAVNVLQFGPEISYHVVTVTLLVCPTLSVATIVQVFTPSSVAFKV